MKSAMQRLMLCGLGTCCLVSVFPLPAWAAGEAGGQASDSQVKVQNLDVIGTGDVIPGKTPSSPTVSTQDNIIGGGGGYFHPYVGLTARYSDNVYRLRDNKQSDWTTVVSPGIWVAVPARRQQQLSISSSTTAPGGLSLFLDRPDAEGRFQGYASYGADIEKYQDYDERDNTKQAGEAFGQYNLRGGLSLNAYDKYIDSEDPIGTGDSTTIDKFKSNLVGVVADYDITQKVGLRLDYNNYILDYDEDYSTAKNRTDNAVSTYAFYRYTPKTAFFVEYRYTDVDYDTYNLLDSEQHGEYLGLKYQATAKTNMVGKLGAVQKNFDDSTVDSVSSLGAELQLAHAFTQKTSIRALAQYTPNETTVSSASYQDMTNLGLTYTQLFTDKIGAAVYLGYTINDYQPLAGQTGREDKVYTFAPTVQYAIQQWLVAALGYSYTKRDSTDAFEEYTENLFFARLGLGL